MAVIGFVFALFLGCLVIRAGQALNSEINADEFHFLHSAWMLGHGYLPYRDFWTNHSPLFIYLLKPLVQHYDENPASLLPVARLLLFLVNLGLFGVVASLAARRWSWTAGLFAAFLLSVNLTVFRHSVDVRHDSFTLIGELLGLALLARGIESGRSRDGLVAGASLGLALAFSPKGLFGLSALVIGLVVHQAFSPPGPGRFRAIAGAIKPLLLFVAGSLATLGLVLLFLLPIEVWPLMFKLVFLESMSNPDRFSPLSRYLLEEIGAEPLAWLAMLAGFGMAARQWWGSGRRDPAETLLLVAGVWFGVTYLFLMSSPYHQSALPFIAVLSIFGGRLLALAAARVALASSGANTLAWMTCLVFMVGWIAVGSTRSVVEQHPPFRRMNAHQIRMIQYVLNRTDPDDAVFDGQSAYIFRPQASYYGSLMKAIRMRIRRGELAFDIPERCERLSCKVVILDDNSVHLPPAVWVWIRQNYVPSKAFPYVLLHKSLVPELGAPEGQGPKRSSSNGS